MVEVLNIIKAIGVRAFLILHVILCVWRVTESYSNHMYWLLLLILIPFTIEGLFTIIRRQGKEFMRFSPCFFLYLCALLPGIWLLELDKSERYIKGTENSLNQLDNDTANEPAAVPALNPGMWILIIEEFMPYVVVISRWFLPRGSVTREQLSELLFAFIGIAADIMEFFSLFGEQVVRLNRYMGYCVLAIWSWAVMQFTMTITVVQQPKTARKIKYIPREVKEEEEEKEKIRHEVFAIFLTMAMQDLPFVIMRLYTLIKYNIVTYSLIFFTAKNLLIIALLLYKVAVLCLKKHCPEPEKKEKEEVERVEIGRGGVPLTDLNNRGAAAHAYANENEDGLKKRSGKPRSNGRANDVSDESPEHAYSAPHHDSGNRGRDPAKRSTPRSQTSKDSADSSPVVSKSSAKAAKPSPDLSKASSKAAKTSPVPSKTSQENDSDNKNGEMPRNESMFGWINDESVTHPSDAHHDREDGETSEHSFNSQSTRTSPLPSLSNQHSARPPSPAPSPPQTSRRAPAPSVSSQDNIYTPPPQTAKPGDPEFKPYVSVLKI